MAEKMTKTTIRIYEEVAAILAKKNRFTRNRLLFPSELERITKDCSLVQLYFFLVH